MAQSKSAKAEAAEAILAAKRSAEAAEGSRDELRRANDWVERQNSEAKARASRDALRVDHLGANRYVLVNSGNATISDVSIHAAGVSSDDSPDRVALAPGEKRPFTVLPSGSTATPVFSATWKGQDVPVEISCRKVGAPRRIY